jgi:hypothetical protein
MKTGILAVAFFAMVAIALLAPEAKGENWLPTETSFEAWGKAKDCTVYRAVAEKSKEQGKLFRREIGEQTTLAQSRYLALHECLKTKGQTGLTDEETMAELCPDDYHRWIAPGYRIRMLQEEAQQADQSLDSIKDILSDHCRKVKAPAEAKTVNGAISDLWK